MKWDLQFPEVDLLWCLSKMYINKISIFLLKIQQIYTEINNSVYHKIYQDNLQIKLYKIVYFATKLYKNFLTKLISIIRAINSELFSCLTTWDTVNPLGKHGFSCVEVVNNLKDRKLFLAKWIEIVLSQFLQGAIGIVPPCRI